MAMSADLQARLKVLMDAIQSDADADIEDWATVYAVLRDALAALSGHPQLHADGWICEQHPELAWPHDDCAGPGMPQETQVRALVYQRDQARQIVQEYPPQHRGGKNPCPKHPRVLYSSRECDCGLTDKLKEMGIE